MSARAPMAFTWTHPLTYRVAIPAAFCLLKLSAYAAPIFSTSCLRFSSPAIATEGPANAAINTKAYDIRMAFPSNMIFKTIRPANMDGDVVTQQSSVDEDHRALDVATILTGEVVGPHPSGARNRPNSCLAGCHVNTPAIHT